MGERIMGSIKRDTAPGTPPSGILLQFLAWIAERPRTYADAMEAWRTSCPRLSVWEDAIGDGLVRMAPSLSAAQGEAPVQLTPLGQAILEEAAARLRPAPAREAVPA
jgi:hypothetical protein